MARLIVEAVSGETTGSDVVYTLVAYVSVSRADTGESVTGLTKANFRICSSIGLVMDPKVIQAYERKWEPEDNELSGVYAIHILRDLGTPFGDNWTKGQNYGFGIQVRNGEDIGQTVISLESLGT
ncbi:MAG: hypothetical protein ACOYON_08640 [Fimbriimonas sp.]